MPSSRRCRCRGGRSPPRDGHPDRPGDPHPGQPGRHRWPRDAAPGPPPVPRLPLRHLLRHGYARPVGRGLPDQPDRRPADLGEGAPLPAVHRQRGGRHLPGASGAQVRELPQHHPGRPPGGLAPGRGGGGAVGEGPAPRPGPGDRVRHRRLGVQRAGAARRRLPVDDHGAPADRSRGLHRITRPGAGRPPGPGAVPGWRRPPVRGQGLPPQGLPRPGQGARRLPPALRPPGPAPHRGRGHQRGVPGRRAPVRRRAGTG